MKIDCNLVLKDLRHEGKCNVLDSAGSEIVVSSLNATRDYGPIHLDGCNGLTEVRRLEKNLHIFANLVAPEARRLKRA